MSEAKENYTAQVLVVDDEVDHAEVMAEALRRLGHVCTIVHGLSEAREELEQGRYDLIVTDLVMDGPEDGLEVLAIARAGQLEAETIVVTAHGDIPTATKAVKQGAYDFIEKPLELGLFRQLCTRAIKAAMERVGGHADSQGLGETGFHGILGTSPAIRHVISTIRHVAPSDLPVLVTGENGTGKELIAHAVHAESLRAKKIFKPVNCAGLSESILESELFGHVRGAFTGAERDRDGVFQYADKGTLFLDEIGDMPLMMQAKLLRVLESGEVVRVGSNDSKIVDVRFISATNRHLPKLISEERFREDLYFRIRGVEIRVPSLRERREDIPALARSFVARFASRMNRPALEMTAETERALLQFDWPGNVRQLVYVAQNMVVMAEGDRIELRHVPAEVRQALVTTENDPAGRTAGSGVMDTSAGLSLDQIEKQAIRNALRICAGNREATAKMLGIGERTLYRKLKEYGIK